MKKKIKEVMIYNIEFAIAFSIVMTIIYGILSLMGVKDWGVPELAIYFVATSTSLAFILSVMYLIVILFDEIRLKIMAKIKIRKAKKRLETFDRSEGETLDKHAEILGIQRAPEETDDDLRYRCIKKMILNEIQKEFQRK